MSDREAFEKWLKKKWQLPDGYMPSWNGKGYSLGREQESWQLWQASRAQAIDECLQLHASIKVTPPDNDEWIDAIIDSREAYQQAIKQLKEQP